MTLRSDEFCAHMGFTPQESECFNGKPTGLENPLPPKEGATSASGGDKKAKSGPSYWKQFKKWIQKQLTGYYSGNI